jgi:hypothetical protein
LRCLIASQAIVRQCVATIVRPGLGPGIHPSEEFFCEGDGLPGQARQ